jgi:hypothetical protein
MMRAGRQRLAMPGFVEGRRAVGLQALLQLARDIQILVELALLLADAIVEDGIFKGDGQLRGKERDCLDVTRAEIIAGGIFDIEDTDQFFFGDQRDTELGAGLVVKLDVTGVGANVGDDDGLAMGAPRSPPGPDRWECWVSR